MIFDLFLSSLLLCFSLVGIHAYFGRHIIKRGIVFADIAVAQFSGLGIALSLTFFHEEWAYYLSLTLALLSSLLIAFSQRLSAYSEAFIGLLYALGFSATVLVLSLSAHGMEEFKRLTAGDLLFVPVHEVIKACLFYAFVGLLLHMRELFLKGFLKELSFFILFSLTLTSSVKLAGILVVFSLLLAPALFSILLEKGLFTAWLWGTFWSFLGIVLSFKFDLPTGYTVAFLQALSTGFVFCLKMVKKGYS